MKCRNQIYKLISITWSCYFIPVLLDHTVLRLVCWHSWSTYLSLKIQCVVFQMNSESWRLKRGPQSRVSFMSEIFRTSSVQKELWVSGKKVQRNILNKLRHVSISLKAEVRIMFRKHASTITICGFSINWNSTIVYTFGIGTFVLSWRLRKQQFCEEDASHQVT